MCLLYKEINKRSEQVVQQSQQRSESSENASTVKGFLFEIIQYFHSQGSFLKDSW